MESTKLSSAIYALEIVSPDTVIVEVTFQQPAFIIFLKSYDNTIQPASPRPHQKNPIDPNHGMIRSIFLKPFSASPEGNPDLYGIQEVRISNDLADSDILPSLKLAK